MIRGLTYRDLHCAERRGDAAITPDA